MNKLALLMSIAALAVSGFALTKGSRESLDSLKTPDYSLESPEEVIEQFLKLVYTEGTFSRFTAGGEFTSKHRDQLLKSLKVDRVEKKAEFALVFFQVETDGNTYKKAMWTRNYEDKWLFMGHQQPQYSNEFDENPNKGWFVEMGSLAEEWEKEATYPWWL